MSLEGEEEVVACLRRFRFRFVSEAHLHDAIEGALRDAELEFAREERLGPRDRIDFYVMPHMVGIEVKVGGSVAAVERQLARYALSNRISELVLVTACARHGSVRREINSKSVHVVPTFGAF